MEAQCSDSFPIEAGREFLRLIERYDRFVNEVKYAEEEAYAKACDPITGEFDEEKYEEPEYGLSTLPDEELDRLGEITQSSERSEEERRQALDAIRTIFKDCEKEDREQRGAEHDEIWGAIA